MICRECACGLFRRKISKDGWRIESQIRSPDLLSILMLQPHPRCVLHHLARVQSVIWSGSDGNHLCIRPYYWVCHQLSFWPQLSPWLVVIVTFRRLGFWCCRKVFSFEMLFLFLKFEGSFGSSFLIGRQGQLTLTVDEALVVDLWSWTTAVALGYDEIAIGIVIFLQAKTEARRQSLVLGYGAIDYDWNRPLLECENSSNALMKALQLSVFSLRHTFLLNLLESEMHAFAAGAPTITLFRIQPSTTIPPDCNITPVFLGHNKF